MGTPETRSEPVSETRQLFAELHNTVAVALFASAMTLGIVTFVRWIFVTGELGSVPYPTWTFAVIIPMIVASAIFQVKSNGLARND